MMKHILLIEDNQDIRETTAEILELANYKVTAAADGKLGVEAAMKNKPDLVICDIMMPVLDGYGVLHIFNQNDDLRAIPFIFLTAKTDRTDIRKGMDMGADDYLTKPFYEIELLNAIESRLKRADIMKKEGTPNSPEQFNEFYDEARAMADLNSLSNDRKVSFIKKKQLIYMEGNEPLKLYFLKSGKIKTYNTNQDGKDFVTGLYNEGSFFGHIALVEETDYKESAVAMEDAEIISIPKQDFLALIHKNHTVAQKFIKMLANSIAEKEQHLLGMAYNSLRKRTADALILLSKKYKNANEKNFSIKISRDDLASVVGTATESLIRTLSDFKGEKWIEIEGGKIVILDEKKLFNLRG
jgi:CRP-like cAMP-binding protein/CheY-like chemotaxis protein